MKLKKSVITGFLALVPLLSANFAIAEEPYMQWTPFVSTEHFNWEETGMAGDKLLEEDGYLYHLGLQYESFFPEIALHLGFTAEYFVNTVDYDGATMGGTPLQSETEYDGWDFELQVGYNFAGYSQKEEKRGLSTAEIFTTIERKTWDRDIKSSLDVNGNPVSGYEEAWAMTYFSAGGELGISMGQNFALMFRGGAKYPITTENKIDRFGVTLEPGKRVTPFAEAGIEMKHLTVTAYYEPMDFSRSSVVNGFFQPESRAEIFGIKVGIPIL